MARAVRDGDLVIPISRKLPLQQGGRSSSRRGGGWHRQGDHLVSLELGGDPRNPDNLWPEPWFGPWNAHVKDRLDNRLHQMVCAGEIPLREAQQAIATDWVAAYRKYVGNAP
jgi:hypothetical protein